jgi:hypothetical protein
MGIAILAVIALAWWLNKKGVLIPNLVRLGGTAVAGLLAFRFLSTGRWQMGLVAGALGVAWWLWQDRLPAGRNGALASAAQLLGVEPDAPSETIWAAWRSAMATAHPDAGGSDAAAQALTQARDLLISAAARRRTSDDA